MSNRSNLAYPAIERSRHSVVRKWRSHASIYALGRSGQNTNSPYTNLGDTMATAVSGSSQCAAPLAGCGCANVSSVLGTVAATATPYDRCMCLFLTGREEACVGAHLHG